VHIRKIEFGDSIELLLLRNLNGDLQFYRNSRTISLQEHEDWIERRVSDLALNSWVAIGNNQLMGVCYLDNIEEGIFEISIRVFPVWRGTECAQALLSHVIERARECGINALVATIHQENFRSLRFFAKNGFKQEVLREENFATTILILK